jgi:geranylgeranyl reductase family protein
MGKSRVMIVGGGPAGCAAAYTLAKKSVDVTVFERGQPAKDKACGDALVSSAVKLLGLFGISEDRIMALGGHGVNLVDMYLDNVLIRHAEYKNNVGWVIPRAVIDQEIRNITAKYASFQYETTVTDLVVEPTGSLGLSLEYKDGRSDQVGCDAVILATGAKNRLSNKLGIHGKPNKSFAVSVYAEIPRLDALIFEFVDSCKPGYRWIFPVSGKMANVGVCILGEKPEANLRLLGEELLKEHHALKRGRWRGGWGPLWSRLGRYWHHPSGVVSCGDAAGLISPYGGEGMTAALRSGEQAGETISDYLLGNRDLHKLEEYSQWVIKHFSHEYRLTPSIQTWNNLCGISLKP